MRAVLGLALVLTAEGLTAVDAPTREDAAGGGLRLAHGNRQRQMAPKAHSGRDTDCNVFRAFAERGGACTTCRKYYPKAACFMGSCSGGQGSDCWACTEVDGYSPCPENEAVNATDGIITKRWKRAAKRAYNATLR